MYRICLPHELTEVKRNFTLYFVDCDVYSNTTLLSLCPNIQRLVIHQSRTGIDASILLQKWSAPWDIFFLDVMWPRQIGGWFRGPVFLNITHLALSTILSTMPTTMVDLQPFLLLPSLTHPALGCNRYNPVPTFPVFAQHVIKLVSSLQIILMISDAETLEHSQHFYGPNRNCVA